jgi:hypothetical protein
VDLLVLIDPELRSNPEIPSNVGIAVNISDDRGFLFGRNTGDRAAAAAPGSTTVLNFALSGGPQDRGSHGHLAEVTRPLVVALVKLAERGLLTQKTAIGVVHRFNEQHDKKGDGLRLIVP